MKRDKRLLFLGIVTLIFTVCYTILLCLFDRQPIGPENSVVGFASINAYFRDLFPFNETIYKVTEVIGYAVIGIAALMMLFALVQLIKRKSLFKVDRNLIHLGFFYVIVFALYIIFDKVVINYRPVILDEGLEASYPSSHTMLSVCIMFSLIMQLSFYIKGRKSFTVISFICTIIALAVAGGRFISGVHWFTDIIGGLLFSATLLCFHSFMLMGADRKKETGER